MKMPLARSAVALALLAVLAIATTAGATVVRYLSLDEHVATAQLIVRVRAGDASTSLGAKDGRPRTDRVYTVLETYKGNAGPGSELKVRQMRGAMGERTLRIPGDPELREGEEAVLFLVQDASGLSYLAALAQSKYAVVRDGDDAFVRRDLEGLAFAVDGQVLEPADEAPVPLALFGETIRALVKGK